MEKYKILIIEDDPIIQTELQVLLNGNGYEASAVTDFTSVMQAVKNTHPYLILLDIKLPQESGYSICSQIRSFSNVPIIFVTSCNTDMDELNSILLGGDAFITKPYNTAILLAKISSLMKRAYPIEQIERLNWQGAILHLESSTIEYDGNQAELTKNELKILYYLTDSNLNHTGIYLYSKGKIMIHLTFDYKTDEKCTTPGQYLKYHRTFQGFTTRELAEKVGIVPATLVLYENDRHPIKHSTAVALANALGIDRNRLLDKYTAFVDYPYSTLLKKVRQELSLTQMQMAEVIGIGQTSYSGWEREIRVPRRKEYEKILAALKKLKVNADTYLCNPAST